MWKARTTNTSVPTKKNPERCFPKPNDDAHRGCEIRIARSKVRPVDLGAKCRG